MPAGGDDSAPLLQPEGTSNNANNDEENAAPAAARTPEQRLAQLHELHFNRTKWLQDLDGSDLSRPERKAATEMAFNILDADQKCQPFEALRLAVENVRKRRHLEEELGVILNDSDSEPSSSPKHSAPEPTGSKPNPEATQERDRQKNKRRRSSASSSCSSSGSESESSTDSGSDTSSESDWEEGKVNTAPWNPLQVPERISKQVHNGEYVDLWWYTPTAGRLKHEEHKFKVDMGKVSLTATNKLEKPKEFRADEDLPRDEFHYACDAWTRALAEEGADAKTVRRWKRFNAKIERHRDRYIPYVQRALQLLHKHQRHTFATRSRKQKAELEKLKKRKMTDKERRKRRKALKRFDPGKFPKNTFQEIKDSLKDARLDTIEDSHSHASQAASARPASGAGPSRQPSFRSEPSRRSGPTATVSKPFRDNGPRSDNGVRKACARCGIRERHRPEECTADRLAYYPGKATHAIRNSSGQLVERSGGRRICLGHNVSGCTWNNCPGEHACSLCGGTCTAQTCRLSRPPQSQ
ncbi:hypothetical protein CF335_g8604 [Tilletia laevis]|nr:hypothetical protein CF335_g8604 [Tilletia laevis]